MKKYVIELTEDVYEEIIQNDTIEGHLGTVDWAIRNAVPLDKYMQDVENADLINKQRNKYIHIDDVYRLIEGHSNYHGDDILSAFTCLAEGKAAKSINPI